MNKLFGLFLLALAFLAPDLAQAANCFWVGGTGSINDVTHWSSSTGGAGSTCAASGGWPNSTADNANLDASSGGGTVTRNVNWTVAGLNVAAFTGTFGNAGDTATVNVAVGWTNNGSGTRTVNLGASTWTCGIAATNACNWSQTGATNLTFNANTSTLVMAGGTAGSGQIANLGTFTYNVVTFSPDTSSTNGTTMNTGNTTIGTLNIAAPNYLSISNSSNMPITTLNFTGGTPSITALTTIISSSWSNNVTLTLTNPATCAYCVFRDVTAVTSAITGTNAINLGHTTNISLTPPTVGGGGGGRIIGG